MFQLKKIKLGDHELNSGSRHFIVVNYNAIHVK
jgi:hypothetical protein